MATKQEILEEKTVEELEQIARDKDLSGYSNLKKDELIDLVKDSLTKGEIKDYFSGAESETKEEELETGISVEEKLKSNEKVLGITAAIIVGLIGLAIGYYFVGGTTGGVTKYENEKLGFSLDYPSGWFVEAHPYRENIFLIVENSEDGYKNMGQVIVSPKENSIEVTKSIFENQTENSENISFEKNVEYIKNEQGLDMTVKIENPKGNLIITYRILFEENKVYWLVLQSQESDYPSYEEKFSQIVESFTLI